MDLKTALRKTKSFQQHLLGLSQPLVISRLLNKDFIVRDGTIREQADYDDAWLYACALHSETVFDIGSNIGQAAMVILLSPSVKELVLVEANAAALVAAAENLFHNHLANHVRFVASFASDRMDKQIQFWTVGTGAAGSKYNKHAETANRKNQSTTVPTVTLDFLTDTYKLVPDLVKIDVEGAEAEVLGGAEKCAALKKTRFFVEMHSNPDLLMKDNALLVMEWCRKLGYQPWYLKEHELLTSPELIQHRGRCHLILQPEGWAYPDWLRALSQSDSLEKVGSPAAP